MQLKQLELAGGGTLTVYLRDCCERMPNCLTGHWCWWCPAAAIPM